MLNLSLRDRIRHTAIRKRNAKQKIELKWKWARHIARTDDNRWTKRMNEWQPRTRRRRRGRQRRRWRVMYMGTAMGKSGKDQN